jgi:hypothetical protein
MKRAWESGLVVVILLLASAVGMYGLWNLGQR